MQPDDPWGFEEEVAETWGDLISTQAVDLGVLAAFLLLAYVSFHRKSVRLKYVTLLAAVAYMGFAKSYLISITNIFSVLEGNLPVFKYNLAWYLFFGFTVVSTVLWGRFYCGRVCAYGAFTQLMDAILPARWRVDVPKALETRAGWIKFGLLAAVLAYFFVTKDTMVYRYVEPFWMFGRSETSLLLWGGIARAARGHGVRAQSLLPLPVPGRRHAGPHVVPDRLQDQALVGMHHLQDLREDLRVGRDRGTEDPGHRVRALRRLRAGLRRRGEVPALADSRLQEAQGRHDPAHPRTRLTAPTRLTFAPPTRVALDTASPSCSPSARRGRGRIHVTDPPLLRSSPSGDTVPSTPLAVMRRVGRRGGAESVA